MSSSIDALTPRQRDVVRMVAGGMTDREIAASTYHAAGTVKWHLSKIYDELGIDGGNKRVRLVRMWIYDVELAESESS